LPRENVVYSVRVKGLDVRHYDLVFEDNRLVLRYLGEYWERTRPIAGLQRRVDLYIYSIRKRRARSSEAPSGYDMQIPYSEIRSYKLVPPRQRRRWTRQAGRRVLLVEALSPRLELELRDGRRIIIEFSPRVYELVKRLVKNYVETSREKRRR